MSDKDDVKTEETKKSPLGVIVFLIIILAVILGLGVYKNAEQVNSDEVKVADTEDREASEQIEKGDVSVAAKVEPFVYSFEKASTPRILGDETAPIKISEHSSFTCPACAKFHDSNFKLIKKDYIDTGKAYLVFDDYPRNKFDIEVGAITRCVSDSAYFKLIDLLFKTQNQWLNNDYVKHVKQNAMLTGASEEQLNNCFGNEKQSLLSH